MKYTCSTIEGPGLQTRLRWVKPVFGVQPSHSLCSEYLWQITNYHMYVETTNVCLYIATLLLVIMHMDIIPNKNHTMMSEVVTNIPIEIAD